MFTQIVPSCAGNAVVEFAPVLLILTNESPTLRFAA